MSSGIIIFTVQTEIQMTILEGVFFHHVLDLTSGNQTWQWSPHCRDDFPIKTSSFLQGPCCSSAAAFVHRRGRVVTGWHHCWFIKELRKGPLNEVCTSPRIGSKQKLQCKVQTYIWIYLKVKTRVSCRFSWVRWASALVLFMVQVLSQKE